MLLTIGFPPVNVAEYPITGVMEQIWVELKLGTPVNSQLLKRTQGWSRMSMCQCGTRQTMLNSDTISLLTSVDTYRPAAFINKGFLCKGREAQSPREEQRGCQTDYLKHQRWLPSSTLILTPPEALVGSNDLLWSHKGFQLRAESITATLLQGP